MFIHTDNNCDSRMFLSIRRYHGTLFLHCFAFLPQLERFAIIGWFVIFNSPESNHSVFTPLFRYLLVCRCVDSLLVTFNTSHDNLYKFWIWTWIEISSPSLPMVILKNCESWLSVPRSLKPILLFQPWRLPNFWKYWKIYLHLRI